MRSPASSPLAFFISPLSPILALSLSPFFSAELSLCISFSPSLSQYRSGHPSVHVVLHLDCSLSITLHIAPRVFCLSLSLSLSLFPSLSLALDVFLRFSALGRSNRFTISVRVVLLTRITACQSRPFPLPFQFSFSLSLYVQLRFSLFLSIIVSASLSLSPFLSTCRHALHSTTFHFCFRLFNHGVRCCLRMWSLCLYKMRTCLLSCRLL